MEPMGTQSSVKRAVAIGALLYLSACTEERRDAEAERLIEHVDAIDIDAKPEERREPVAALEKLRFQTAEIESVRQLCARAHRAFLDVEDEASKVRDTLDELGVDTSANLEAEPEVPAKTAGELSAALSKSNAALERAGDLLPRCQDEVSSLRARHAPR